MRFQKHKIICKLQLNGILILKLWLAFFLNAGFQSYAISSPLHKSDISLASDTLWVQQQNVADTLRILTDNGFLSARVLKSNEHESATYSPPENESVALIKGPLYRLEKLKYIADDTTIVRHVNQSFSTSSITEYIQEYLLELEEKGNPFAHAEIAEIQLDEKSAMVDVIVRVSSGDRVVISGLSFIGNRMLSDEYLERDARFTSGKYFSPDEIRLYRQRLSSSLFLTDVQEAGLQQINGGWHQVFEVEESRSSAVDLVFGYDPAAVSGSAFVGRGDLRLENLIAEGSRADLKFERLPQSQSRLYINYNQYWIGQLPLFAGGGFELYQQDSTYFYRSMKFETGYDLLNGYQLGVTLQSRFTGRNDQIAPVEVRDGYTRSAGVHLRFDQTDRRVNTTRGLRYHLYAEQGLRQVRNPEAFEPILKPRYLFTRFGIHVQGFIPLGERQVLSPRFEGKYNQSDVIFTDNLFRFGGSNSMRGYLEEQLRASAYFWSDLEYRFLLDRWSYMFVFAAGGIYETPSIVGMPDSERIQREVFAGGFGLAYRTPIGLLRFSYAVSGDDSITNGKVHLGIQNIF